MKSAYSVFKKENAFWYEESNQNTFEEIGKKINSFVDDNDVVLLKGSHSMGLEKLVPFLAK